MASQSGNSFRGGSGLNQGTQKACTAAGGGCLKISGSVGPSGIGGGGTDACSGTAGDGGVACGSSLARVAAAAGANLSHDVWSRLTLRVQVLHRGDASAPTWKVWLLHCRGLWAWWNAQKSKMLGPLRMFVRCSRRTLRVDVEETRRIVSKFIVDATPVAYEGVPPKPLLCACALCTPYIQRCPVSRDWG